MPKKAGEGFLNSAEKVLRRAKGPMKCKEIVAEAKKSGYLISSGKTPENTLHAMISRNIQQKGKQSKFLKVKPGWFKHS